MRSDDSEQEMDYEGQNSSYIAPSGREWFEVIAQGNYDRAAARNIFLPRSGNFLHSIKNFPTVFTALLMFFTHQV